MKNELPGIPFIQLSSLGPTLVLIVALGSTLTGTPALHAEVLPKLEEALRSIDGSESFSRQRLSVRKVIRDAEVAIQAAGDQPERWSLLQLLLRAQQTLIKLEDDPKHRAAVIETCRELVKAPKEFAELRLKPDLLLSQVELAKKGASAKERGDALMPFVERYIGTPAGKEAIKTAILMATELGDSELIIDLRQAIDYHYGADREMIMFQREHFKGEFFAATLAGSLRNSNGRGFYFPMDAFGNAPIILFWSREGEGFDHLKALVAAAHQEKDKIKGRIPILSCNVDGLKDGGESIVRGLGADWPCIHLPEGRAHPFYRAYAGSDPFLLRVSGTGKAAIAMGGIRRHRETGAPNYLGTLGSLIARSWTQPAYLSHLSSVSAGDFLVQGSHFKTIRPTAKSVPEEKLDAIQSCFVSAIIRNELTYAEQLANYTKAVDLCQKVIAEHTDASDLWMVRDRLIVALMGLWKTDFKTTHLEAAFVEAKAALEAGYPEGGDLVARFCLARQAMRARDADTSAIIDAFCEGEADGPSLAVATLLCLDAGNRVRYEQIRNRILKEHTEQPAMWAFSAFLLDRHHQYWLSQPPFTFGWIYDLRQGHFATHGRPEPAQRMLKAELKQADGRAFRIPEDLKAEYTAILFSAAPPWSRKREDGLPTSPFSSIQSAASFAANRPGADVEVALAVFGDEPYSEIFKDRSEKEMPCTMLALPGGQDHPLVRRMGLPSMKSGLNAVLIDKQGRVLITQSGLTPASMRIGNIFGNMLKNGVAHQDALKIQAMIDRGEAEAAKKMILVLAPHLDPGESDKEGRTINRREDHLLAHLRARARAYAALKEWSKAFADADLICKRRARMDADISQRSKQLGIDEAFREEMRSQMAK